MATNKSQEKQNSISKDTKQSLAWFTILPSLLHIFRFAGSIVLARILSPADFGLVGIATVLLYYSNSLTDFGISKAIIQRKDAPQEYYDTYFSFNVVLSIVLFLLFNVFSTDIANYFHEPLLDDTIAAISTLFLINALIAIPMTEYRREIKFKSLAIVEAVKVFISIGVSLVLAIYGWGFWSIIFAMLLSNFIAMLVMRINTKIQPKFHFHIEYFKNMLSFAKWDFVWGQAKIISDNIDKILIGRMLDITQLGLFEKAQGLAKMPNEQFSNRLGMVSFSSFSRLQDNPEELKNYLTKMMVINALVCFPVYIGLLMVAEDLTYVLLGEKWMGMVVSLQALSLSFLIASIMAPMASMNIAIGKIKHQTLVRVFGLVLFIIALLQAVPHGIDAVSYVTIVFNAFLFVLTFFVLKSALPITFNTIFSTFFPSLLSATIMAFVLYGINQYLFLDNQVISLSLQVVGGGITYAACILVFRFKQLEFIRTKVFNYFVKTNA